MFGRRPSDPQGLGHRKRELAKKGPRDPEEDRPELGPPEDQSRFTEETVLGSGERRSSRNVDDGLPGHDRIGLRAQTFSPYKVAPNVGQTSKRYNLAPERGVEWYVTTRAVPAMEDCTVRRTADMVTEASS